MLVLLMGGGVCYIFFPLWHHLAVGETLKMFGFSTIKVKNMVKFAVRFKLVL